MYFVYVPNVPPLAVRMSKLYRLPKAKGSKDAASRPKEKTKLDSRDVDHEDLTEVGRTTRSTLQDTFGPKHCGFSSSGKRRLRCCSHPNLI